MKNLHDMKMKDLMPEERPVEKYLSRGATALSNGELLAIILRTGTGEENALELAQRLLLEAGGSLRKAYPATPGGQEDPLRRCHGQSRQ